jgi:hypothetical protein
MLPSYYKIILWVTLSIISFPIFAYQPPVGIPDPTWGATHPIDSVAPSWPSNWPSQAVTDYYYIDNTDPNATDSGNQYGYPDKPRQTIPETTYAAGSYVEIHGGPYTAGGQLIFTANGTASAPVWFRGGDASNKPIIRGETVPKGSYIFIENLKYDTSNKTIGLRPHNSSSLDHVVVRNCEFAGPGTLAGFSAVIGVYGESLSNRFNNIVIYNNDIHHFGVSEPSAGENDYHGIAVGSFTDQVWVLENHVHHNGGDSIQVGTASTADQNRLNYIYIGKNTFHDDRENAIDIKEANYIFVSENTMYGYESTSSSEGGALVAHNNPNTVWVINNKVSDAVYGLISTGSIDTYFIGNEISNTDVAIHFRSGVKGGVINNTLYKYGDGIQISTGTPPYTVFNNIFAERTNPSGNDIKLYNSTLTSGTTFDNNLFYHSSGDVRINWNSTTSLNLSDFQASHSSCQNCVVGNPYFRQASNTDFIILSTSAAESKGADLPIYDTYKNLTGISIKYDINGNPRPMDGYWDIGAHEISGTYNAPPSPPVLSSP